MTIYIPTKGPNDWQAFLADPAKHWKAGYSARTTAFAWEAANGLPPEIAQLLPAPAELLFATPEHKVPLPGGRRASQCDVFALVRAKDLTFAVAVEAKVSEPFGPTIEDWLDGSPGKNARLSFLLDTLGLAEAPLHLHYQLLHRSAASLVEARRFKTDRAAMLVHSFSQSHMWFEAFEEFAALFGAKICPGESTQVASGVGTPLTLGWAVGDSRFLER